jgi:hypothetical protein
MSYQLTFDGAASAELTNLLRAVERQLNWHGMHMQVETEVATQSGTITIPPKGPCPNTGSPGHNPNVVADILIFGIGLVVGAVLTKLFVQRAR